MSLPADYVRAIWQAPRIWLVIMGKDPYPTAPQGIPFLKAAWGEMIADDCSGGHVLRSLGFQLDDATDAQLQRRYDKPRSLFVRMAKSGIVFLNLVYPSSALQEDAITLKRHKDLLEQADVTNAPICALAWLTVLCGQAKKRRWLDSHATTNYMEAVHPEKRCRIHQDERVPKAWAYWWSQDAIYNWVRPIEDLHAHLRKLSGRDS